MNHHFCLSHGSDTVWQLALPVGIDAAVHAKAPERDFTPKLIPALLKKSITLMEDIDTAFYHDLSCKSPHASSTHCYARHTLVGRSETNVVSREVLTKRRNVLDSMREHKVKGRVFRRSQAECLWTQVYTRLRKTRMRSMVQAAYYLY